MKEWIETGRTVEEAIEKACEANQLNRDEIKWEILDLPRKSFFGLKSSPAKVRIYLEEPEKPQEIAESKSSAATATERYEPQKRKRAQEPVSKHVEKAEPKMEERPKSSIPNPAKEAAVKEYLWGIFQAMELKPEISVTYMGDAMVVDLAGDNLGAIIGKRGETLDAVQYLTSLAINKGEGEYQRVTINCGNYREKRKATLESLAKKVASQCLRGNSSTTLEPMNPFERRIIHATVSAIEGVKSTSIGDEPNRRVVISSLTARKYSGGGGGGRGQGGRNERKGSPHHGGKSGGDRNSRPPRRDRDNQSRAIAPNPNAQKRSDAGDTPLYTKIELDSE